MRHPASSHPTKYQASSSGLVCHIGRPGALRLTPPAIYKHLFFDTRYRTLRAAITLSHTTSPATINAIVCHPVPVQRDSRRRSVMRCRATKAVLSWNALCTLAELADNPCARREAFGSERAWGHEVWIIVSRPRKALADIWLLETWNTRAFASKSLRSDACALFASPHCRPHSCTGSTLTASIHI